MRTERAPNKPIAGLILTHIWLEGRGTSIRGKGRLLLPCTLRQLADAGLGEPHVTDPAPERQAQGEIAVVAHVEQRYAGITLQRTPQALEGQALRDAVATLVFEHRLFKGADDAILDDLHLWRLLANWPSFLDGGPPPNTVPQAPDDHHPWLSTLLTTLGLNESSELALLEADDLRPDLNTLTTLPDFVLDPFRDAFPRQWRHDGGLYHCDIRPAAQRVVLTPIDATAKRAAPPNARYLPHFHGFRVTYQKASRVIELR